LKLIERKAKLRSEPFYYAQKFKNTVMHFENKEKAYCDYVINHVTMIDTDFFELTDSTATEYSFYYDDVKYEGAYAVIIVVR
jgi:hypothetical protein